MSKPIVASFAVLLLAFAAPAMAEKVYIEGPNTAWISPIGFPDVHGPRYSVEMGGPLFSCRVKILQMQDGEWQPDLWYAVPPGGTVNVVGGIVVGCDENRWVYVDSDKLPPGMEVMAARQK